MPLNGEKPNNDNRTPIPAGDGCVEVGRSVCDQQQIGRDQTSDPACALNQAHAASGSATIPFAGLFPPGENQFPPNEISISSY